MSRYIFEENIESVNKYLGKFMVKMEGSLRIKWYNNLSDYDDYRHKSYLKFILTGLYTHLPENFNYPHRDNCENYLIAYRKYWNDKESDDYLLYKSVSEIFSKRLEFLESFLVKKAYKEFRVLKKPNKGKILGYFENSVDKDVFMCKDEPELTIEDYNNDPWQLFMKDKRKEELNDELVGIFDFTTGSDVSNGSDGERHKAPKL